MYFLGGPPNKDFSLLGSLLGSPYFEKIPYAGVVFSTAGGKVAVSVRMAKYWVWRRQKLLAYSVWPSKVIDTGGLSAAQSKLGRLAARHRQL